MTAKEKAEELIKKHSQYAFKWEVKQAALITVDEIINECLNWSGGSMDSGWDTNRFDYLEEVKKEIQKL
jgi:hypothetical protein